MRDASRGPKVVLIGGGSGSSVALRGLKRHTANLTAIVTMFDSGGSSGILRREFGYPPLGDLRQCLVALSDEDSASDPIRQLVDFRFQRESSLNGHSLGNLLLAALTTLNADVERAIDELGRVLKIRGRVVPVTLGEADLCAELQDGTIVNGESNIDLRAERLPSIRRVFLKPEVKANPRALQAILEADAVVLGPGDLYTSIVPNLLASGVAEALRETRAPKIYVSNLMTKVGETDGFRASDFVGTLLGYFQGASLDWAVINTRPVPYAIADAYRSEGAEFVEPDIERVQASVGGVMGVALHNSQQPLRHDPERLGQALMSIIGYERGMAHAGSGHTGRLAPASLEARWGEDVDAPEVEHANEADVP